MERLPSKAFCMPPINDWQLVQTHEVVEPPSYVSMDEFPTQKQSYKLLHMLCVCVCVHVLGEGGISSESIVL